MTIKGYNEGELTAAIRAERLALTRERMALMRCVTRLTQIDDRLAELEKAENLLENGFG